MGRYPIAALEDGEAFVNSVPHPVIHQVGRMLSKQEGCDSIANIVSSVKEAKLPEQSGGIIEAPDYDY